MMRLNHKLLAVFGLAVLAAVTTGCNNQLKRDYDQLQAQYNALDQQNKDLKDQLEVANKQESDLQAQLAGKDAEIAAERARAQQAMANQQAARVVEVAAAKPTVTQDGWEETDRTAKITVGTDVMFDAGRATLTVAGKRKVAELASAIRTRYAGGTVLVYGHTDSDPIRHTKKLWQDNLDLSANRAMAVSRELMGHGVSAKLLETIAMGDAHPDASNSSAAGKAKNRRVEIVVLKK